KTGAVLVAPAKCRSARLAARDRRANVFPLPGAPLTTARRLAESSSQSANPVLITTVLPSNRAYIGISRVGPNAFLRHATRERRYAEESYLASGAGCLMVAEDVGARRSPCNSTASRLMPLTTCVQISSRSEWVVIGLASSGSP